MADPYELRADQLERSFSQMGLVVRRESSRVSMSEYIEVESPEYTTSSGERGETLKFRVSNHELPHGYLQPDFEVIADDKEHGGVAWNRSGTWYEAVQWASDQFGLKPKGNALTLIARDRLRQEQARQLALAQKTIREASAIQATQVLAQEREAWLQGLPLDASVRASRRLKLVAEKDGAIISNGPSAVGWMGMSNSAIAGGMSQPVPLAEALAYNRQGIAPPQNSREYCSQALGQARMQERPAVRADSSGTLEEPTQLSVGGERSNGNACDIQAQAASPGNLLCGKRRQGPHF